MVLSLKAGLLTVDFDLVGGTRATVNESKYFGVVHVVVTAGYHDLVTWLPRAHVIDQTQHRIPLSCINHTGRTYGPRAVRTGRAYG